MVGKYPFLGVKITLVTLQNKKKDILKSKIIETLANKYRRILSQATLHLHLGDLRVVIIISSVTIAGVAELT
ncbi:hypothetical protein DsansV1_C20g0164991 [Dioscorea sansibarensis]